METMLQLGENPFFQFLHTLSFSFVSSGFLWEDVWRKITKCKSRNKIKSRSFSSSLPREIPSLTILTQNSIIKLIVDICFANLIPITNSPNEAAVSEDGLQSLLHQTGLDEAALLQYAMNKYDQIDDLTKTRLLFGLLLRRGGLRVIKEDGKIIAPVAELCIAVSLVGHVSFPHEITGRKPDKAAPNLQSVCQLKTQCAGRRAHQLIQFILHKLTTLPVEETLLAPLGPFRLKSYSSVINKLFYRGKDLTDLLAATVANETDLRALRNKLNELGATMVGQVEKNGNGDLTYRFVRILRVELEGSPPAFHFPVYYEVIKLHHNTPVPHKQYEWTRLEFALKRGDMKKLRDTGFTVESIELGTAPIIDAQLAPQRPQTDNGPNPSLGEISHSVCLSSLSIHLSLILMKCLLLPPSF
jgi:hypothetical protein